MAEAFVSDISISVVCYLKPAFYDGVLKLATTDIGTSRTSVKTGYNVRGWTAQTRRRFEIGRRGGIRTPGYSV